MNEKDEINVRCIFLSMLLAKNGRNLNNFHGNNFNPGIFLGSSDLTQTLEITSVLRNIIDQ